MRPLVEQGRHDGPNPRRASLPPPPGDIRRRRFRRATIAGLVVAALASAAWLGLFALLGEHALGFAWPCGVAIGLSILRAASDQGSARLGVMALVLTLLSYGVVDGLTWTLLGDPAPHMSALLYAVLCVFWRLLGLFSACRIAAQRF
jgi:hypothetical protein